jgi:hypothetical protein
MKTITKAQLVEFAEQSRFDTNEYEGIHFENGYSEFDNKIHFQDYPIGDNLIMLLKLLDIEVTE